MSSTISSSTAIQKSALDFIAHMRENKVNPAWASFTNALKAISKGKPICYIRLNGNSDCDEHSWVITPYLLNIDKYENIIINEGIQNYIWDNVHHCMVCRVPCIPTDRMILGKEIKDTCGGRQPFWFHDPNEATISCIKRILELEKMARKNNAAAKRK